MSQVDAGAETELEEEIEFEAFEAVEDEANADEKMQSVAKYNRPNTAYKQLILAVDIESGSKKHSFAPFAIGMVLMTPDGDEELKSVRFVRGDIVLPPNNGTPKGVNENTWRNFWLGGNGKPDCAHNLDNLKQWIKEAKNENAYMMGMRINKWLNDLETEFPNAEIIVLSDNPAFDLPPIDFLLDEVAGRDPVRQTSKGEYRDVQDPTEQMKPLHAELRTEIRLAAEQRAPHNHDPVSDARHIAHTWVLVQQYRGRVKACCLEKCKSCKADQRSPSRSG
jgi:hypothetical protein